jgi:hypothetical protein
MEVKNLNIFIKEKIEAYPELKESIMGFYHLCLAEIAEGGEERYEVEYCINDVNDLIEENN